MAGTLTFSGQQQFDINGQPLVGALLYFYEIGTVATPQNSYQDFGLSILNPNPLPTDTYGRIPNFYLADGQVHARFVDATGVVVFDYDNVQVLGPSSSSGGGGGGGNVDPTTIASTGDIKFRATSETLTGWVKLNGLTIGAAISGATQRANADTQSLFVYLWINFSNAHCPVSGGRGASGLADFRANKTIQLPDLRARVPTGLDDMGNAAAGIIQASNVTSGGGDGPTTAAAFGGEANHALIIAELAAHDHSPTVTDPTHSHGAGAGVTFAGSKTGGPFAFTPGSGAENFATTDVASTGITVADQTVGSGTAHNNMAPFLLGTWYAKL